MQNLEQKRAAHALKWAIEIGRGKDGGEVVKKIPPLIVNNGILASMAFAVEPGKEDGHKNPGHYSVFKAIISHLQENCGLDIPPQEAKTVEQFLGWIVSNDSAFLRAVTAEALAYMSYLRRFVKKETSNGSKR